MQIIRVINVLWMGYSTLERTTSGQASVRTTQHNMTDETCSVILYHHNIAGENSGKLHGWQAQRAEIRQSIC